MLYFGDCTRSMPSHELYRSVLDSLSEAEAACFGAGDWAADALRGGHSKLVGAAVALGELHQAVADCLSPHTDEVWPQTDALAGAGILLGRCVYRSSQLVGLLYDGGVPDSSNYLARRARETEALLRQARDEIERSASSMPYGHLEVRSPEGYAFYALYPEMYFASLHRSLRVERPRERYAVIGIRTIGSSLAPLVAGALADQGFDAQVETVRPRGHPFARQVHAGAQLRSRLQAWADGGAGFLVVDEGPGLSCSSFLSVYSLLEEMGVEENRLAILSSWQGAPGAHSSPEVRDRWSRARAHHTPASELFEGWRSLLPMLEHTMAKRDDLPHPVRLELVEDLSYGRWMAHYYPSRRSSPPVHKRTERIKLLLRLEASSAAQPGQPTIPEPGQDSALQLAAAAPTALHERRQGAPAPSPSTPAGPVGPFLMAKFAGLGHHGEERFERASALASAGFSPGVHSYSYGFLIYHFLPGRPLTRRDLSPALLSRMIDYYVYLAREFSVHPAPRFDRLAELILINSGKGLGSDASAFLGRWQAKRADIDGLPLILLDGRPHPHEWIEVAGDGEPMVLKTDSADHAEDHSVVGEQSIVWEIAGSWEEWRMSPARGQQLLRLWESGTGDSGTACLVDFYRAAYLAFRLGGMHYAIQEEADESARRSLQREWRLYAERLVRLLRDTSPEQPATTTRG